MNVIKANTYRIGVVDAIRGFSILGILIIHSVEHFNFLIYPEVSNEWLKFFDEIINTAVFFLFSGKAYAIFALLFGFSFFIQDYNQGLQGNDFRLRFLWRLFLLFIWGIINAIFYTGDILVFLSMNGLILLLVGRLSNKVILSIAILLMLQPLEWAKIIIALIHPSNQAIEYMFLPYYYESMEAVKSGNFIETVKGNLISGQLFSFIWQLEHGRLFQTSSLLLFGVLIGRLRTFTDTPQNIKFWIRTAIISIIAFLPLKGLAEITPGYTEDPSVTFSLNLILSSLRNFAFMAFLISIIILGYYRTRMYKVLDKLSIYGRMSLTMYITQSIFGSFIFYNWGLGLADKLSVTQSLIVAVLIFAIQYTFAHFWFKSHKQGPLEYVWKKATWIGVKDK